MHPPPSAGSSRQIALLAVALFAAFFPLTAAATICPGSPTNWAAATCDVGGTPVCTTTSTTFTCDVSGAGGASKVWVVENYDGTYIYEAWGDVNGTLFCCHSTTGYSPTQVLVVGSDYGDELRFNFSAGTYYLAPTSSSTTQGEIRGGLGNDYVVGSESTLSTYTDLLQGEENADTILAGLGDDTCYGGDDDDTVGGGAGDDYIEGGAGDDTLTGGDGDDDMFGGTGRDFMGGGDDDDEMDGGAGGDVMCGDGETASPYDQLDDGDADSELTPDVLWASAIGLDTTTCGSNSTKVGLNGVTEIGPCSATHLTVRPPSCP